MTMLKNKEKSGKINNCYFFLLFCPEPCYIATLDTLQVSMVLEYVVWIYIRATCHDQGKLRWKYNKWVKNVRFSSISALSAFIKMSTQHKHIPITISSKCVNFLQILTSKKKVISILRFFAFFRMSHHCTVISELVHYNPLRFNLPNLNCQSDCLLMCEILEFYPLWHQECLHP